MAGFPFPEKNFVFFTVHSLLYRGIALLLMKSTLAFMHHNSRLYVLSCYSFLFIFHFFINTYEDFFVNEKSEADVEVLGGSPYKDAVD